MKKSLILSLVLCALPAFSCLTGDDNHSIAIAEEKILFKETFEDTNWESRGWYDGPHMEIAADEHIAGSGHSCVWRWLKKGDISPVGGGARVKIEPVDTVILRFSMKHSADWRWTGVPYHPHEFHFLTTADDYFVGPAYTNSTFYIEVVNGVPRIAIQDSKNIDESRVGENLVGITENRAVAGGNGDSDGYGPGDCYKAGDVHRNGKFWEANGVFFGGEAGKKSKSDWHTVKARLKLNTVKDGVGQRDGELQYWLDGALIIDHKDVVFRTGKHPDMLINQFMMAPYFGPGVPGPQTIWIDDLTVATEKKTR